MAGRQAGDAFLSALGSGVRFDTARFKKDVTAFSSRKEPVNAGSSRDNAASAKPSGKKRSLEAAIGKPETGKAKKRARTQEAALDNAVDPGGMAVFRSRQSANARDGEAASTSANARAVAAQTEEAAARLRKQHKIRLGPGQHAPAPLESFAEIAVNHALPKGLLKVLQAERFADPTPIQRQAIPAMLSRQEILAIAPTGSGKTLAFLLPIVIELNEHERGGVRAVILSPTHELASQTYRVLKRLDPKKHLRAAVLKKATAAGCDFSALDVLIANPLRLSRLVDDGKISLERVLWLVLDEADQLFQMGFVEQIDSVLAACKSPAVRRALFTATLPETVEELARTVMQAPIRVTVGQRNGASETVTQKLMFCGRETGKLLAMRQLIAEGLRPPALVFVQNKDRAQQLYKELSADKRSRVGVIHSDLTQSKRDAVVEKFRVGDIWILVATDLVARGMDFVSVNTVVNFDFPQSTTQYVHRVGRAGRAGRTGEAITLFTEDDGQELRSIANVMRASGCEVPEWMLTMEKAKRQKGRKLYIPQRAPLRTEKTKKAKKPPQPGGGAVVMPTKKKPAKSSSSGGGS